MFDTQSLINLIDKVKAANGNCNLTYFCYGEPPEHIKEIVESNGVKCKVIENKCNLYNAEKDVVFIIPTHELPIKIKMAGEQNENN